MEVNTSLLRNNEGEIIGAIAHIRDITRRKRMEELMVRVDKLASLGELSAGIAHEIRNPLAGIKTSVQVLAKRWMTGSEKVLIDGVLCEIDRLNKIIADLLNFSRPTSPLLTPVDISVALEKSLDLVSEKIKKSGIQLIREYEQNLSHVIIDKLQIQQVFLNLLLNAIKAMPGGGNLTISRKMIRDRSKIKEKIPAINTLEFAHEKRFVEITFKDTGHGIEKENLSKAFDPFYTTDPSGTGLGLSIVHKLLEKNNSYIHIESIKGKGTSVTLFFPTAAPPFVNFKGAIDLPLQISTL